MTKSLQSEQRRNAFEFARIAIRAYERDQCLENAWEVEVAMRLLRESSADGHGPMLRHLNDAA